MNIDFGILDTEPSLEDDQTAQDALLLLQTRKVELTHQRDALQTRKAELVAATERLRDTWREYERQQRQYEIRAKLEHYLLQNDNHVNDDGAFVHDNLNVLPSRHWPLRLECVRRFYPHMDVGDVRTTYQNKSTKMEFCVTAHALPALRVAVHVTSESVQRLEVLNWAQAAWHLRRISPTFFRAAKTNFLPRGKVDLLMHGYHALARLQQTRVTALRAILDSHPDWVVRPEHWADDVALDTVPYIELTVSGLCVRLLWALVMRDTVTAEVESDVLLEMGVERANEVFLALIPQHGIVRAFHVMLANVFGV